MTSNKKIILGIGFFLIFSFTSDTFFMERNLAYGDTTPPTVISAVTVTTTTIDVTFSEDLDALTVDASDFVIQGNNDVIAAAETSPGVVTLTLNSAIGTGDTPTVKGSSGCKSTISDVAGNEMCPVSFTVTDGLSPTVTIAIMMTDFNLFSKND